MLRSIIAERSRVLFHRPLLRLFSVLGSCPYYGFRLALWLPRRAIALAKDPGSVKQSAYGNLLGMPNSSLK